MLMFSTDDKNMTDQRDIYIYVHVPVCTGRCLYCDFYSTVPTDDAAQTASAYIAAALDELRLLLAAEPSLLTRPVASVYFGGGTPSLAPPAAFKGFLSGLRDEMTFAERPEITLEIQPGTCDAEKLLALFGAGINRFSVGVQSFAPEHLHLAARRHTVDATRALLTNVAQLDGARFSVDLISCWPGQTAEQWNTELDEALSYHPEHLSVYELTYYDVTPLLAYVRRVGLPLPDEDLRVAVFEQTTDVLRARGFEHYEISNYALPHCRSRHNENYWTLGDYIGVGAGAHSFLYPHRYANPDNAALWAERVAAGLLCRAVIDPSDAHMGALENFQMALRLADGVDMDAFARRFGTDIRVARPEQWRALFDGDLLTMRGGRVVLTRKGVLCLDSVIEYLI